MIVALVVASLCALLHVVALAVQSWALAAGQWEPAVDWSIMGGWKMAIVIIRPIALAVLVVLLVLFVRNIVRARGNIFLRANSKLIFLAVVPYILYAITNGNLHWLYNMHRLEISSDMLLVAVLLVVVGGFYRKAALLSEENELTI